MKEYWEMRLFGWMAMAVLALGIGSVIQAWVKYRAKWRHVAPYYGSPYDASVQHAKPRQNVRLVRP